MSSEPVGLGGVEDINKISGTSTQRNGEKNGTSHSDDDEIVATVLPSTFRLLRRTWMLAVLSLGWTVFTIVFAFNCSLPKPFSDWLLPSKSQNTLLALNIFSHGVVQLLGELALRAFDTLRWALATSKKGIPARSFLGLSSATGLLGVLYVCTWGDRGGSFKCDRPQYWGISRYYRQRLSC
jgi:hypothetical protein